MMLSRAELRTRIVLLPAKYVLNSVEIQIRNSAVKSTFTTHYFFLVVLSKVQLSKYLQHAVILSSQLREHQWIMMQWVMTNLSRNWAHHFSKKKLQYFHRCNCCFANCKFLNGVSRAGPNIPGCRSQLQQKELVSNPSLRPLVIFSPHFS